MKITTLTGVDMERDVPSLQAILSLSQKNEYLIHEPAKNNLSLYSKLT